MRELKFRGIDIITGKFQYGNYIEKIKPTCKEPTFWTCFIQDMAISMYEVKRETVGQFTGKIDSNGVEIYEGDKVTDGLVGLYEVDYDKDNCSFFLSYSSGMDSCEMMEYDDGVLEIVGNIHEKHVKEHTIN